MTWLDELDAAAVHAMIGDAVAPYGGLRSVHVRPERIRALIAIVRAAETEPRTQACAIALAALEATP